MSLARSFQIADTAESKTGFGAGVLGGTSDSKSEAITESGVTLLLQLKPLDENVPIFAQLNAEVAPVVLVNVFQVAEEDIPTLLKAWEADANWMKQQPGYISTQLHRGIAGSTVFLNYALWESVAHFRAAFNHPEFKQALEHYPSTAVASPHLFTRLPVSNLCVGP